MEMLEEMLGGNVESNISTFFPEFHAWHPSAPVDENVRILGTGIHPGLSANERCIHLHHMSRNRCSHDSLVPS